MEPFILDSAGENAPPNRKPTLKRGRGTYGALRSFAHRLGYESAARALQDTLEEEDDTDH